MSRLALAAAGIPLLLTTACASSWQRSYERWRGYGEGSGPYSAWARCVTARSNHHLDTEAEAPQGTRSQLFTSVLADCREHMSGPAWEHLPDAQVRRLLDDAWQAFNGVNARIMARRDSETI